MRILAALSQAILFGLLTWNLDAVAEPFRYAEDQAPGIINPIFATTMSEARINELVFEGLYADDQQLRSAPLLAESHEIASDGLSITVYLRGAVVWHDGTPFTSKDVVFTILAMQDPGTYSAESGKVRWIKSAEAIDRRTVRIHFHEPELRPQDKLTFKILPEHRFTGTTIRRRDPFHTQPIGTGPYQVIRFNDDNSITLDRFTGYRGRVGIGEVTMREVGDKNYQARLLHYQSLDALVRVLPRDLAQLQANREIELYPYQTNSWWYMGFNLTRAPFDDARVRHAIGYAIDVQALLDPIGTGDLLSGPFVRSSPFYNHDVPPRPHNPAYAAELLREAGYTLEDGAWMRRGQRLTLRITAHKALESSQEVVINLQSQLKAQGIEVFVDSLDEAAWKANVWRAHDFDMILSTWSFDRNEDVRHQLHSKGGLNFTGYSNARVDELLDIARSTPNPHSKKEAMRELHSLVQEDAPMLFLWTLDSYSAMSTGVKNVMVHPFYFFTWAQQWQMQ
jgi:peptide/nickel transport system substrate-binding protein